MTSSNNPPILPTTITTTTTTSSSDPPVATPAFRTFLTRIQTQVQDGLSQRRPWSELADHSAFSKPESLTEAASRIRKNYSYFRINYLSLITLTLGISLITHPFSLFTLAALLAAWCFLYLFKPSDQPLFLFNREFSDRETLGMLSVLSIFAVFLTSVASVLMSALVVGIAIVCAHAAFRHPEDLFLDDQGDVNAGVSSAFLNFLVAPTNSAAVATTSTVATAPRV